MTLVVSNLAKFCRIKVPLSIKYSQLGYEPIRGIFIGPKLYTSEEKRADCFSQFKPMSETRFTAVSHIIMDLDGIVLDTAPFYFEAHTKYLLKFKKRYTAQLKINSIGIKDQDAAKYLIEELDLPMTPPVYAHGVWQYLRTDFPKSKMIDGAKELICHLHNHHIPIALATSSDTKSFELKTRNHKEILKLFCHIVLGDDPQIKHGKPAADIYEIAGKRFNNAPSDHTKFLVIEDSAIGVQAAKAAGMQSVLVPDKSIPRDLLKGKADLIVDSLKAIDLRDFDLPRIE